ncbi:MBL fold metallo-hydrolase [Streptomyces sp. RM72]|uniref:alkyl/aryl-sulfatase n=1 Tax=unclassified Streptomyces TaxID=2593676 RepID=UPI000978E688|nr:MULTISPECIES: alkyl sulfatase dimerization domain-containing protein [unclassified Streptomyces]MBQ0888379.1 MBL fold metallo-hydrolase [Streptomyces sp. RM72]OMI84901.1 alkyl/aryl-sulfatase [Streptomyces sp. M1013]
MNPMNRRGFVTAAAGAAAATVPLNAQVSEASPGRPATETPTPTRTGDLPYEDRSDFADADRGFVAAYTGGPITTPSGSTAWDPDAHRFLADATETPPATVDPSLWRQARLLSRQGLYQVTERIYQIRGLDLSNMTVVEGDTGIIVIDPLTSAETAAAALRLYRAHRGNRPVRAMIYTHPHVDHFGGCRGVLPDGTDGVPVLAPRGFMEHAVSENVYAGPAMSRRAGYMYGSSLPTDAAGQVGCGLGLAVSTGTVGLIPPTRYIEATGQETVLDGVRIRFQMTPGTECQEEMNFLLPDLRAVCMAENATHTMHNILTLRGAQVRDAHAWAGYLTESIGLYAGAADVAFASHHWPTWGNDGIVALLTRQRDLYAYLHDQTVRLINKGLNGTEIAESLRLPPQLERVWANRGYYGSLSHNVKAVYQRYMGWFDANPAHLWEHPPAEEARRWVESLGGQAAVRARARHYSDRGDLRFAVTLLNHAVFNDPDDTRAKRQLATLYVRLGRAAENAVWRNFYLTGAQELMHGIKPVPKPTTGPDLHGALTVGQLVDGLAVRVDGPAAWSLRLALDWHIGDVYWHLRLANGVLTWTSDASPAPDSALTMTMTKPQLLALLAGKGTDGITMTGDGSQLAQLLAVLDTPDRRFPVVTPAS